MKALFPGSFDPVTLGHLDLAERAARFTDELVMAVLDNPSKHTLFTMEERAALIAAAVRHIPNIKVDAFQGLLAQYVSRAGIDVIIKGVRSEVDYGYEAQMAQVNRMLTGGAETLLLVSDPGLSFLSSSTVREVARMGYVGGFDETALNLMVPPNVAEALRIKFSGYAV